MTMLKHGYIFRIDDVHPSMDWQAFQGYMDLLGKYGVVPLLGIIPDCRDASLIRHKGSETFWNDIRGFVSTGKAEISQHGFHHVYGKSRSMLSDWLLGRNPQSEFRGLPFHIQMKMIAEGKAILASQGLFTEVFMPPSHTMDGITRQALLENGFSTVSDGVSLFPYKKGGLFYVPQQQWSPKRVRKGIITICFHSGYSYDSSCLKSTEAFLLGKPPILKFSEAAARMPVWTDRLQNGMYLVKYIASYNARRLIAGISRMKDQGE